MKRSISPLLSPDPPATMEFVSSATEATVKRVKALENDIVLNNNSNDENKAAETPMPTHHHLRPQGEYKRIDDIMFTEEMSMFIDDHAIHDTLNGLNKIEVYEIYKHENQPDIYSIIKYGSALNGHPGVVHGGITALMFDNTFGWLFYSLKISKAVTANLNINYRKPIFASSTVILKTSMEKQEGRKLYMKATMESEDGTLLADATTLFIILNKTVE